MAKFVRNQAPVIIALGAGLAIGAGAVVCYHRYLSRINRELLLTLETLQREIAELRNLIEGRFTKNKKRGPPSDFFSAHASSGEEDDDIYEEAYGGDLSSFGFISEYETVRSTSSGEYLSPSESLSDFTGTDEELFNRVDLLLEGTDRDKQEACRLLRKKQSELSDNADFMWRLAKATYFLSQIEGSRGNLELKKDLVYQSVEISQKAVELDDSLANAHKWYAIAAGSTTEYESTQHKIETGYIFKNHIEKAIELNPKDPSPHYLLGRFCLSAYMLTWWERKAAATLFGEPPSATIDETLDKFMQAEQLNPGVWKENMLHIAKCLIEKRDYSSAMSWLDRANELPCRTVDDKEAQQEVNILMSQYSTYRT